MIRRAGGTRSRPFSKSGGLVTASGNATTELLAFDVAGGESAELEQLRIIARDPAAVEFVLIEVRVDGIALPDYARLSSWPTDAPLALGGIRVSGGRKVQVVAINLSGSEGTPSTYPPSTDVRMVATCDGRFISLP